MIQSLTVTIDTEQYVRVWVRRGHDMLKRPTLAAYSHQFYVRTLDSFSDWFPKRERCEWDVKSGTTPKWGQHGVRVSRMWRGPRRPGELMVWEDAYALFKTHVNFLL